MICCYLILDLVRASERVLQLVTTADSRTVGPAEMAAGERRKGTALVGQPARGGGWTDNDDHATAGRPL